MNTSTASSLVKKLQDASIAYYETDTPLMSDNEYDALVEQLMALDPSNPFFASIGANPKADAVLLPVPMPSLDKRKPDTLRPSDLTNGPCVLMDKLDGISALWCSGYSSNPKLYLRGNGSEGQDISHCIRGIQGLRIIGMPSAMVRGELIVPKGVVEGTLARNWVNGQLHQGSPSKEDLSKIRFVAYQVCEPRNLTRCQQVTWLQTNGFEVAWFRLEAYPTIDSLSALFKERRLDSPYECDGIVVGQDRIPAQTKSNPKDAFAFKMPLEDQKAQTTVKAVLWASSRTGNWIPRIQFEPVTIGTAVITYCSGFHAQNIMEHSIGPGATIVVRRSGDVIPIMDICLSGSPSGWSQPPEGLWAWDANHIHAVDTSTTVSAEKLALELTHGLVVFDMEGISKTTAKKLVDGGVKTLQDILKTPLERLQTLIGKVNGSKLHTGLPLQLAKAPTHQWIYAYHGWPKAFGKTRIASILELEADVSKWSSIGLPPKGISADSFTEIVKAAPAYLAWRASFPVQTTIELPIVQRPIQPKGNYVLTGFRDPLLQTRLQEAGWIQQERVTKSTNLLLIPTNATETTKVQAARAAGIRILPRDQVETLFQN